MNWGCFEATVEMKEKAGAGAEEPLDFFNCVFFLRVRERGGETEKDPKYVASS